MDNLFTLEESMAFFKRNIPIDMNLRFEERIVSLMYSFEVGGVQFDKKMVDTNIIYSVPEKFEININGCKKYITGENYKQCVKEMFIEALSTIDDFEYSREITTELVNFYAKIRPGEVWTNKDADRRIKEIEDEFKLYSGYDEV